MFSPKVLIPLTCNHSDKPTLLHSVPWTVPKWFGVFGYRTSHFIHCTGFLRSVHRPVSSWSCRIAAPCTGTALWNALRSSCSTSLTCCHPGRNYALCGKTGVNLSGNLTDLVDLIKLHTLISGSIFGKLFTVVVKAVSDLMSDHHSYPTKVEGLVLLLAEEGRLEDSSWKHCLKNEI